MEQKKTCQERQAIAEDTQKQATKPRAEMGDIPEAKGSEKKPVTCREMVLLIFFIIQLGTIAAVVYLYLQTSKQLEQANILLNCSAGLDKQLNQTEIKPANLTRNQTHLQMQLEQSTLKINESTRNQTYLQMQLEQSAIKINELTRNQTYLQMQLEQSAIKISESTRNQTDFQMQLEQAERKMSNLTQKQSDLQVQLQRAQQNITQLNSRLQGKCCPVGWESLSPNCYYFATSSENWFNAQTRCKNLSSNLVVIKSKEEQEFIKKRKVRDQSYWIGLTDTEVESTWKWVDGSLCSSSSGGTVYWYKGQPNGQQSLDEDCAIIYLDGSWHDFPCDHKFPWICEAPAYTCFS